MGEMHIIDALYEAKKASKDGCLDFQTVKDVAAGQKASMADARALAGFYEMLEGKAKTVIEICAGNPCELCGNEWIAKQISDTLGIEPGETTDDGLIAVKYMNCCGHCAKGPVVRVGGQVYEEVTKDSLAGLIDTLKA